MDMQMDQPVLDFPPRCDYESIDIQDRIEKVLFNRDFRVATTTFRDKWAIDRSNYPLYKADQSNYPRMLDDIDKMMSIFTPKLSDNWGFFLFTYLTRNIIDLGIVTHDISNIEIDITDLDKAYKEHSKLERETKPDFAPYIIHTNSDNTLRIDIQGAMNKNDWDRLRTRSDKLLNRSYVTTPKRSSSKIRLLARAMDLKLQKPKLTYREISARLNDEFVDTVDETYARKLVERAKALGL